MFRIIVLTLFCSLVSSEENQAVTTLVSSEENQAVTTLVSSEDFRTHVLEAEGYFPVVLFTVRFVKLHSKRV